MKRKIQVNSVALKNIGLLMMIFVINVFLYKNWCYIQKMLIVTLATLKLSCFCVRCLKVMAFNQIFGSIFVADVNPNKFENHKNGTLKHFLPSGV